MRLLEFVERYNNMANQQLKDKFIKEKVKITPYVSIIKKDAYAQLIVDKTTFEQEAYDDNGTTKYRKTDKIRVNSVAQYVQFCRAVIELYTDLEIDKDDKGFIKEYDALKSSGLLDILMVGSDKADPLIPMSELSEFKTILTMKQSDTQFNETTTQAFISKQIKEFLIWQMLLSHRLWMLLAKSLMRFQKKSWIRLLSLLRMMDLKRCKV